MRHPPARSDERRRWKALDRSGALETENAELRRALREILHWYDSFDQPGGSVDLLTDDDFERYRNLARGRLKVVKP